MIAPRAAVRELPAGTDPAVAATVGVAGKTAWHAVHNLARVQPGDVVLVLGASGGVGTFATQLAAVVEGVTVLAHTSSPQKAARLESLGLQAVVASDPHVLIDAVADAEVSVVLDPLGGDYVSALTEVIRPRGRVITYGVLAGRQTRLDLARFYGKGLQMMGTSGATTPADDATRALKGALDAVTHGRVRVDHQILPLSSASKAFDLLASRQVEGKILLQAR